MVGRLGPQLQQDLLVLLLAVSEGRSEEAASVAIKLGTKRVGFAESDFRRTLSALVLENRESTISQLDFGQLILRIARISGECSLRLPSEVAMIGKALLNLDRIVWALDPDFEPSAVVREEATLLVRERLQQGVNRNNVTASLLEIQSFAGGLPERVNKVLDVIGGNELRVTVDALDEHLLMHGMQKIANRIALGLVLGSLIVGAALLMRVPTTFRIFEYPGLAILLFLAAAAAGVVLMLDILYYDDKRKAHLRESKLKSPSV